MQVDSNIEHSNKGRKGRPTNLTVSKANTAFNNSNIEQSSHKLASINADVSSTTHTKADSHE